MEVTRQIAELALGYNYDDLPEDVIDLAKLALLDNIGCAVRGSDEPLSKILCEELIGQTIEGSSLLSGQSIASTPNNHAMVYAATAHAIDFDDTLPPAMAAHAGSSIVGALMALLPYQDATGKELITAIVTGYETASRIGALLDPEHYSKGFHPTATVGVFGAAAACGKLLGFNLDQMQQVFGLAATQAAGIKCVFGTMTKPYNAGHASSSGVLSARLVARGFTSAKDAVEASKGYLDMFMGKPQSDWAIAPADEYAIRGNAFKFHAACHATHPMIEAIGEIKSEAELNLAEIKSVTVQTSDLGIRTASVGVPTTGLECKFSYTQVAASALLDADMASDDTYSEAMINKPELVDLREKVIVAPGADDPFVTEVAIELNSGERLEKHFNFHDMMKDREKVKTRIEQKFLVNAEPVLGNEKTHKVSQAIWALAQSDNARNSLSV